MQKYVALLKGINVGGHRVKMDRLRSLFEEMGFEGVETYIASGNVIFESASADVTALTTVIERALEEALGYPVPTFLRTPEELRAVAAFEEVAVSRYVFFFEDRVDDVLRAGFEELRSDVDDFRVTDREVYWLIGVKMSDSPLFRLGFDKMTRGVPTTTRNMTTVQKLVAKLSA